ncbi:MAG: hypothetical protein SV775_08155 [Thermodesulfobacteriota bacterium]|nr:hypothetical protein [Thermodesulfobacteriota bacterium]
MKKGILIIVLIACGVVCAGNVRAQGWDEIEALGVEIHGFVSQAYLYTKDNNFLAHDTEGGSFQFNEFGLTFGKQVSDRLRLGLQLFSRDMGNVDDNKIILDWANADYRWRDWAGIRAGILKVPYGLYNKSRDVDALRTNILLPQSVYTDLLREGYTGLQGVGLYGFVPAGSAGRFLYEFQMGTSNLENDGGTAKFVEDIAGGFVDIRDFDPSELYTGAIYWNTPIHGLRAGVCGYTMRLDADGELNELTGVFEGMAFDLELEDITSYVFSLEYSYGDLLLAAEYCRMEIDTAFDLLGSSFEDSEESEGYYLSASYRFTEWLELGTYYSVFYEDVDDRDGDELEVLGFPDHGAWLKDLALTTRFDIGEHWVFKLEGHMMDGTARVLSIDNPPFPTEDDWFLFAAKMTFIF